MLARFTEQLRAATPLADAQVADAIAYLVNETISAETKADFLTALAQKGETTEEIAAFARELRTRSLPAPLEADTRPAARGLPRRPRPVPFRI